IPNGRKRQGDGNTVSLGFFCGHAKKLASYAYTEKYLLRLYLDMQRGVNRIPRPLESLAKSACRPAFEVHGGTSGGQQAGKRRWRGADYPCTTVFAIMQWMPLEPFTVWVTRRSAARLQSV